MRLKELRKQKNLTQQQVANQIGLKITSYNLYENEKRELPKEILIELAKLYNVSTDYVLGCNNKFDLGYLDDDVKEMLLQIKTLNKDQKKKLSGYIQALVDDIK